MSLIDLARKWIGFKVTEDTSPAQLVERDAFTKRSGEIWLAYHDNALWAQRKLATGLFLTPEALEYMDREVTARKLAAEARTKNLETENVEYAEAKSDGEREPAGAGERDVGGAAHPVQA